MRNPNVAKDIKTGIKNIEKYMINNIFNYLKNGVFPEKNPDDYFYAYVNVQTLSDMGDNYSYDLFQYYNTTIKNYILECKNELTSENNINFIVKFLEFTNKINILIYWMCRVFTYLDRYYLKSVRITLSESAMNLYKSIFYEEIKNNIFIEVNKLINEDRNG